MPKPIPDEPALRAAIFAALGDQTRLAMLARLSGGMPQSIARLTEGTDLSRQAVTKHLRVLEDVGMVRSSRHGRESLFELDPSPLARARDYLGEISAQWDDTLVRLKSFIENPPN